MKDSVIRVYLLLIYTALALTLFSVEGQNNSSSIPPDNWKESWNNHTDNLTRVYFNNTSKVVIYFGENLCPLSPGDNNFKHQEFTCPGNASWLFDFTSNVWSYMNQTYGQFGINPYLFLVIHRNLTKPQYIQYSRDRNYKQNRNILDINPSNPTAWLTSQTRDNEMDLIVNRLSSFVDHSSKQRLYSPSFHFLRGTKHNGTVWTDIFTYDVYSSLNMTHHAKRYNESKLNTFENYPEPQTFWYRSWSLPVYNINGNKVLNEYFQLLSENLPTTDGVTYNYTLNMGEFVHFWSGATHRDLRCIANNLFPWNTTYNETFTEARQRFGNVTKLYRTSRKFNNQMEQSLQNKKTTSENPSAPDKSIGLDSNEVIIGMAVVGTIILSSFLVLIAYLILFKRKIDSLESNIRVLTNIELKEFHEGDKNCKPDEIQTLVLAMPFITDFEIPRDQMILDNKKVFGTGQFGSVVQGFVRLAQSNQLISVAIKTAKPDVEVDFFKIFLSEVKIMAYLGDHENIVKLYGTCTTNIKNREIFIALEICSHGSLQDYLKKNRENFEDLENTSENSSNGILLLESANSVKYYMGQGSPRVSIQGITASVNNANKITRLDLIKWSHGVANAMVFLTQKKVIHGDLAARNILLTEHRVAKVSDFGLSRQFLNYANYTKKSKLPVPWRWLAIECLKEMKFSIASDVWAFGVTMWEIFSLAELPYGAWTFDLQFANKLIRGDRLLKPPHSTESIYKLMTDCWKIKPTERPTFQQIHNFLGELITVPIEQNEGGSVRSSHDQICIPADTDTNLVELITNL